MEQVEWNLLTGCSIDTGCSCCGIGISIGLGTGKHVSFKEDLPIHEAIGYLPVNVGYLLVYKRNRIRGRLLHLQ